MTLMLYLETERLQSIMEKKLCICLLKSKQNVVMYNILEYYGKV